MEKIKLYVYGGITLLIVSLVTSLIFAVKAKQKAENDWKIAMENYKTYSDQYNSESKNNRALKLTIDQLNASNDSIIQKLKSEMNTLKIKNSQVQSLQYVSSNFTKNDTITLRDTIFRNPQVNIDTLLSDEWYSIKVGLKYPSTVSLTPEFKSEKHIIVSSKKETVDPPKKFFLLRWFQKKHTILNIDVIEKNPYMQNQNNRYIEIIK